MHDLNHCPISSVNCRCKQWTQGDVRAAGKNCVKIGALKDLLGDYNHKCGREAKACACILGHTSPGTAVESSPESKNWSIYISPSPYFLRFSFNFFNKWSLCLFFNICPYQMLWFIFIQLLCPSIFSNVFSVASSLLLSFPTLGLTLDTYRSKGSMHRGEVGKTPSGKAWKELRAFPWPAGQQVASKPSPGLLSPIRPISPS